MSVAELEDELAHYEFRLGQLQSEITQSNSIIERVQVKTQEKQKELAMLVQQLAKAQQTLTFSEKLCNTSHSFISQALQNNGQIAENVLGKLHLLDKAHSQILGEIKTWAPEVVAGIGQRTPSKTNLQNMPQQTKSDSVPPMNRSQSPSLASSTGSNTPSMPRLVSSQDLITPPKTVEKPKEDSQDNYSYFGLSSF